MIFGNESAIDCGLSPIKVRTAFFSDRCLNFLFLHASTPIFAVAVDRVERSAVTRRCRSNPCSRPCGALSSAE